MVWGDLRGAVRSMRGIAALVAGLALVVVTGCGSGSPETADGAALPCGDAVLRDWADGSIDRDYSADCYLAAIDDLPEDVRTYTSAEDDITRALQSRTDAAAVRATGRHLSAASAETAEPAEPSSLRLPPVPVLLLAVLGLALAAVVLGVATTRRVHRDG
jgi:hypothetical protein